MDKSINTEPSSCVRKPYIMKILAVNAGSSSLKFKLFLGRELTITISGVIEKIGASPAHVRLTCYLPLCAEKKTISRDMEIPGHCRAVAVMFELLQESGAIGNVQELTGIGHRVVHGGEEFKQPVIIDEKVIAIIEELIPLAPLHNPVNLTGIRMTRDIAGTVPQVAVFDTAFHQSIPEHAFIYALPYRLYRQHKVRRYGFHGTSHQFVVNLAGQYLNIADKKLNCISLHLGNGASCAAIARGLCVDTSMGMTPLEGLIMGTRSGDLDPAILFYLNRTTGMDMEELDEMLNKESGLQGICGENDMRTITELAEQGDRKALLALEMFCYRLKKYIGSYLAVLGKVDCLIFTGGIGENSAIVRRKSCQGLEQSGIILDHEVNLSQQKGIIPIHGSDSPVKILVIPTDEELAIAIQTRLLHTGNREQVSGDRRQVPGDVGVVS